MSDIPNVLPAVLGSDQVSTLEFFSAALNDLRPNPALEEEVYYTASVLAHFALTPRGDMDLSAPADMSEVFDKYLFRFDNASDMLRMETAGSKVLWLNFFWKQMRIRHDMDWCNERGQAFYVRAGSHSRDEKHRRQMLRLARHFPDLALMCRNVSSRIKAQEYLYRDLRFLLPPSI